MKCKKLLTVPPKRHSGQAKRLLPPLLAAAIVMSVGFSTQTFASEQRVEGIAAEGAVRVEDVYAVRQIEDDQDITADITDPVFLSRIRVVLNIPYGPITRHDVEGVTVLNLASQWGSDAPTIRSLAGIEHFINLEQLNITNNPNLIELNLHQNSALRILNAGEIGVETLDLRGNVNLETVLANNNLNMERILLPDAMPNLTSFSAFGHGVHGGRLTSLTLRNAPLLTGISLNSQPTSFLDLSNNPSLVNINNTRSLITDTEYLILEGSDSIRTLNFGGGSFTNFDTTKLPVSVIELGLSDNNLEVIDLSGLPNLELLNVSGNNLTTLNVTNNPALLRLIAGNNQIAGHLDLTNNPLVWQVWLQNNQLTSIDVTGSGAGRPPVGFFMGATVNVANNNMMRMSDVVGWQAQIPTMHPGANFAFFPQRSLETYAPIILTEQLPDAIIGQSFSFFFEASGNLHGTWEVIWPHEQTINLILWSNSGLLEGIPVLADEGTWNFTVRVTNAHGYYEKDFTITVRGENPIETRQLNFNVSGIGGTISAFINGTEIQSGARVPVGSTVLFLATPYEGFAVGRWNMGFGNASGLGSADDLNSTSSNLSPVTFTLRNMQFDHVVEVSFVQLLELNDDLH